MAWKKCSLCNHRIVCMYAKDNDFNGCGLYAEERPQWIPCSERLPEKYKTYIVTVETGEVFEYDYNNLTIHDGKWSYCRREIVAWMPMPEPYKKEGEKNEC